MGGLLAFLILATALSAQPTLGQSDPKANTSQPTCPATPLYSLCELNFDLPEGAAKANPNPYLTVQLQAEFRSPRHHQTLLIPAFWDGGARMVIRFAPNEVGDWMYRLTSNLADWDGKTGQVTATESESAGFIKVANRRAFMWTESGKAHLWMGDTNYKFTTMDRGLFEQFVAARAKQKFNHMRGLLIGGPEDASRFFPTPDQPDPAQFREIDARIRLLNSKGIIADLMLAGKDNHLTKLFPAPQQRERYIRYLTGRYSAMNITWQGVQEFESYKNGRALAKEVGLFLKKHDAYQHPRSCDSAVTGASLLPDGWMDYVLYQTGDQQISAIERQLYAVPMVNVGFAVEDSGAGKSQPNHVDEATLRHRLWNAAFSGQYVGYANTGTYGYGNLPLDAKYLEAPGAKAMTTFYEFWSKSRYWDLEPFFAVDGGRAMALELPNEEECDTCRPEGIEYLVYVEKPGPIEVVVERRGYDVAWFNPISGEFTKMKEHKSDKLDSEPPDKAHDWVLRISREGKKASMLNSYKFESHKFQLQEVEGNPQKIPFDMTAPTTDLSFATPPMYAVKLKRVTRATRSMMYLWTGEVLVEGQGYRVVGTGPEGTMRLFPGMAEHLPASLNIRVTGLNANGKAYWVDKVVGLSR